MSKKGSSQGRKLRRAWPLVMLSRKKGPFLGRRKGVWGGGGGGGEGTS